MRKMAEGLSLFFLIFVVFFSSNPVVIVSLSIDRNLASTVSTVTELQEPLVMGYSAPFGQLYDVEVEGLHEAKRAPAAYSFYGMRGKKAPSMSFYGMRGKKAPFPQVEDSESGRILDNDDEPLLIQDGGRGQQGAGGEVGGENGEILMEDSGLLGGGDSAAHPATILLLSESNNDEKKRAPSYGFLGLRGRRMMSPILF